MASRNVDGAGWVGVVRVAHSHTPRDITLPNFELRRLVIGEGVREHLINHCDSVYPKEAGGYLFGTITGDAIHVDDILPLSNQSPRPRTSFRFSQEDSDLADICAKTKRTRRLGIYHSHPDASMPSTDDIRAAQEVELWILHKKSGTHDFIASWHYTHLKVEFESEYFGSRLQREFFQLSTGKLYVQQIPTVCRVLRRIDSVHGAIKSDIKDVLGTERQVNRYLMMMERESLIERKKWEGGCRGLTGDKPDHLFTVLDKGRKLLKLQAEYESRLRDLLPRKSLNQGTDFP